MVLSARRAATAPEQTVGFHQLLARIHNELIQLAVGREVSWHSQGPAGGLDAEESVDKATTPVGACFDDALHFAHRLERSGEVGDDLVAKMAAQAFAHHAAVRLSGL